MKMKINIAAAAAILTLKFAGVASAQQAVFDQPSYSWNQGATSDIPGAIQGSVGAPIRPHEPHAPRPYGQW